MHHGEYVDDEEEYSESDSEIDEHLLPSRLLELDVSLGYPRPQCRKPEDDVHAEEVEQQGVEHEDDESCGSPYDAILDHSECRREDQQRQRDDVYEEFLHRKHFGSDDIRDRDADRNDAPDYQFPVIPACEHRLIVRVVRHKFVVEAHSEKAEEQDADD